MICIYTAIGTASTDPLTSDYKAIFQAPTEVNMAQTSEIRVTVEIRTPEGKPYSGPVDLWSTSAAFKSSNGKLVDSPISVNAVDGKARATISLDMIDGGSVSSCRVDATMDMYLCGSTWIKLRYPDNISTSDVQSVKADGITSPGATVLVKDQYGNPLDNVPVDLRYKIPNGRQVKTTIKTNSTGIVNIILPPSKKAGIGYIHACAPHLSDRQVKLVYTAAE